MLDLTWTDEGGRLRWWTSVTAVGGTMLGVDGVLTEDVMLCAMITSCLLMNCASARSAGCRPARCWGLRKKGGAPPRRRRR